jgi:hypothetical protein
LTNQRRHHSPRSPQPLLDRGLQRNNDSTSQSHPFQPLDRTTLELFAQEKETRESSFNRSPHCDCSADLAWAAASGATVDSCQLLHNAHGASRLSPIFSAFALLNMNQPGAPRGYMPHCEPKVDRRLFPNRPFARPRKPPKIVLLVGRARRATEFSCSFDRLSRPWMEQTLFPRVNPLSLLKLSFPVSSLRIFPSQYGASGCRSHAPRSRWESALCRLA